MPRLGIKVMLDMLSDNSDIIDTIKKMEGQKISALVLDTDSNILLFTFTSGLQVALWDDGQSCCEERYIHTDDDLDQFIGSIFRSIELRGVPDTDDENGIHEMQFVHINTSVGTLVLETHNIHNGYYGGFSIRCAEVNKNGS